MKRPLLVAAAVLASAVLIGAAAVIARHVWPPERRLVLPAVERFAPGACRDAAETVRSLARLTHGDDVTALTRSDRAELRRAQDRLVALRTAASADVREPMEAVIVSVGYLRLRLDSRTAEPRYLTDVETARARLERTCVGSG
ncbi:hypothetical protein Ade02nite_86290 [Paractinoplanes deccanensis]|uniref:Uncharacterized protein n=1 Tax=Paractinoplanes deccanensis TaxID=113561 RepID=A0ABQ3YIZ6_9ACTN|nr:hypothetical protein [Actinoplanes deccanensis]GID79988.1 hypothetical protein Ade02nite_86290 [Actinoplanes deccanensis]